jgi:hypothetical protein
MYALPISIGSFLGTFAQVTIEKKRNDKKGGASPVGDADKDKE